ncbi:MAG: zinc ribbon domain-containing protein [Methanoregulaceae archaeon]|nr:MAG: zinc ribbon domain-containing protein [Methanoregulaceae archaeon]
MAPKYCTACGEALSEGKKFCESCGSPVVQESIVTPQQPAVPAGLSAGIPPPVPSPEEGKSTKRTIRIVAILFLLIVVTGAGILILPEMVMTKISQEPMPGSATPAETIIPIATVPAETVSLPAQKTDPFPDALRLQERLHFGTGTVAGEATVYKYWINDTYQWHNDMDNHYYVQKPEAGNKYLFVFVHMQNNGDTRVWFPPAGSMIVYYNGAAYHQDQSHFKPDKSEDFRETPVEVKEVQYFPKLNGDEYAEDFGFSHGTELAYLYPGGSNAVDGYIIYEVPQSLTPEKTYVGIPFNTQDQGVWKLG